jgi:glycosyltransferase involved in cell wall biosynthesis
MRKLKKMESIACGTPVIAFGFGSMPGIVQEGITGVVVPEISSGSLVSVIRSNMLVE